MENPFWVIDHPFDKTPLSASALDLTVRVCYNQDCYRCTNMAKNRQIIHVDMDAYYASVEQLDNPDLAGKPLIVGGNPKARGVVSAASYEARKYGVHSAMPMARAVRLCPDATVLGVRMERYVEVSHKIHDILDNYTPLVEPISLDEAFLDVTGSTRLFGSAEGIGHAIKKEIRQNLGLTASVGIAPNKFLAKLASDLEKPDGFVVITDQNKRHVLDPLPVGKIWGVGKVTEKALHSCDINTIGQLRGRSVEELQPILGNHAVELLRLASGIDDRQVEPARQAKSISSEETFATDLTDKEVLLPVLRGQVEEVAQRLRACGRQARTLTLKLRYADFTTITRSFTLVRPTDVTRELWQGAQAIFEKWLSKSASPLRLLGFAVSGFGKQGQRQLELFGDQQRQKYERLDRAVDQIRSRYGRDALKRGL